MCISQDCLMILHSYIYNMYDETKDYEMNTKMYNFLCNLIFNILKL